MVPLGFNKACEVEDFSHPEIVAVLHELFAHRLADMAPQFPHDHEDRADWEAAMTLRALRRFGATGSSAMLLAVSAGATNLVFHMARLVGQVVAVDCYLDEPSEGGPAPFWMMAHPEELAPFPIETTRMAVQHMDPRHLRFPDNTFDGVFCGRPTEFDNLADAASAFYDIGRVLKPGGVASVVVDLRLAGPPGGTGWPSGVVFSPVHLMRFVVDASGLEPVDPVTLAQSERTLATPRRVSFSPTPLTGPAPLDGPRAGYPDVIRVRNGYVVTSAHLTLLKAPSYPRVPNQWARPTSSKMVHIKERDRDRLVRR